MLKGVCYIIKSMHLGRLVTIKLLVYETLFSCSKTSMLFSANHVKERQVKTGKNRQEQNS